MNKLFTLALCCCCLVQVGCSGITPKTEEIGAPTLNKLSEFKQRADVAYGSEKYTEALRYYMALEDLVANDPQIYFKLGNTYSRLHQPEQAVTAYKKALLLNPRMSKAWHNMGVIQLRQSANTWVQMVSEISPDDPLLDKAEFYSREILRVLNSEYKH